MVEIINTDMDLDVYQVLVKNKASVMMNSGMYQYCNRERLLLRLFSNETLLPLFTYNRELHYKTYTVVLRFGPPSIPHIIVTLPTK